MHKKFTKFFFAAMFFLTPTLCPAEKSDLKISADIITAQPDGSLYAEGNILVEHNNIFVKAEALSFNQKTNLISFVEIKEFYDGNDIRFSAEEADINSEFSTGVILAANLLLDETIKIRAQELQLQDGEISDAIGISRVTSCKECDGKEPNWSFTASSAKREIENSNIVYRNVTVRLKGLPVAYIPYLRMPDPSVDRARGFLVPEAVITSNLATGLKLPYFVPMGLSRDILITPYFSTKTRTLEYRYRQKFRKGNLSIKGAFSFDDLSNDDLRYFSQLAGNLKLGYGIELNFDVGKISDKSYLGDYVYFEESDFDSQISLGKTVVEKNQFFDGELSYLREKKQGNSLSEYYSLYGSYAKHVYLPNLPGQLRLSANLNSSVNVNDDDSVSRPPSSAQVAVNYNQFKYIRSIQFSNSLFVKLNSFVNSADAGTTNEEFSLQYGAITSVSSPLYLKGNGKTHLLTPKFSLAFTGQENDIIGDYFIGMDELSWGNLNLNKKIMSLTEIETDLSVSLGLENQIFWDTGQRLSISFAAAKIGGLTYQPTSGFGLPSQKLNFLGKFSYQTKNRYFVNADTLFSSKGQLIRGNLEGKFSYEQFNLGARYEVLDQLMDSRLPKDLSTLDLSSSYGFLENFSVSASGRYDLTNDQMATTSLGLNFYLGLWEYNLTQEYLKADREKSSLSLIYDDECTRLTFSFENRYQDLGSSTAVKSLMFRVQLKPFANVVFSQGRDQITF